MALGGGKKLTLPIRNPTSLATPHRESVTKKILTRFLLPIT